MSLLVVGSVALDSVESPFGRREDALGGSATFFSTAASILGPVQLVGVIGEDFPEEHLSFLRSRGIDLSGLVKSPGKTFRWKGRYSYELNEAQTLDTQLNVFETFSPNIPPAFQKARYVFLGNIDPVLQSRVLDQVERPKLVAADTMNFWIRGKRADLLKTLSRVDLLFVNDAEARELAGESNILKAARAIQRMGPQRVAVKRGEYGAMLVDGENLFASPALPLSEVFDPTGAGDTFAGGFLGFLARQDDLSPTTLRQGLAMGTVMASFTVESFSLDRLRNLTRSDLSGRYTLLRRLTQFEDLALEA
jgi:sugar/nucleoside kinase (ribokinase family)